MTTAIGLFAGACSSLGFLPQVVRTIRTGHAADLSIAWLLIFGTGVAAWLVYGLLRPDLAIILTNGLTLFLVVVLAVAKVALRPAP
ncbi:MAG: hypothetical protein JST08_11265 [Actinobacteria bacterium]|nr:hypothetical protein [Actinomycetota bacterium]